MATFRLYSDIVGEEEKVFLQEFGLDGHCYKDINDFLASIPADDNVIDIRIHCRGGSCVEGWAMYDALRRSKKKIYATVEGECSSMATVVLLAAPLERRTAYKNAHFCIHNPAVDFLYTDMPRRLTADAINTLKSQLGVQEASLREEQERIINLYVTRTKAGRKELIDIMSKETFITAEKAIELGFICKTLAPNTARRTANPMANSNNHSPITPSNMSKPQSTVAVKKSLLDRMLAMCGLAKLEDVTMRDQVVTAADGREFTVEREDGDPQIGDTAYPDGTYTLEDGTVIVIEDNLITSISVPDPVQEPTTDPAPAADPDDPNAQAEGDPGTAPAEGEPEGDPAEQGDTPDVEELQTRVAELETNVTELETRVTELEAERDSLTAERDNLSAQCDDLKQQVDSKADARVLTEDENAILETVAKAGGKAWLDGVTKLRSTYNSQNRRFVDHSPATAAPEGETKTQRAIREQKERYAASHK